jgi:hypothetical protein
MRTSHSESGPRGLPPAPRAGQGFDRQPPRPGAQRGCGSLITPQYPGSGRLRQSRGCLRHFEQSFGKIQTESELLCLRREGDGRPRAHKPKLEGFDYSNWFVEML